MSHQKTALNKPQTSSFKIPSKTFLMGEYSVLLGGRALVLTHSPFFTVSYSLSEGEKQTFHPESPAGMLLKESLGKGLLHKNITFDFSDPHSGTGGFGGSTAEFISVCKALDPLMSVEDALKKYFLYFKQDTCPPSGADLCAQFSLKNGVTEFQKTPLSYDLQNGKLEGLESLIFKTQNKVKTHKHLEGLSLESLEGLKSISESVVDSYINQDIDGFINGVDAFTKEQALQGLLHMETMQLVYHVNQIPGVVSSRGCGAMGADVFLVFVKPESKEYVLGQILTMKLGLQHIV